MATPDADQPDRVFTAKRVVRPRVQVEQQIRHAILSGTFARGERLPSEGQLAQSFSVSRPTVREALRSLAATGFIHKVPGASGGSFVKGVDPEALSEIMLESMANILRLGSLHIEEVTAVRRLIEVPAARLAAEHRDASHLDTMRSVVDQQRSITLADPEIPALDRRFHATVADASGNRLLAAFVLSLHMVTRPASYLELSDEVGRCTVRQHIAILDAITAQDADAAATAMSQHLDYVLRFSSEQPADG